MKINPDDQAFPHAIESIKSGLTKREYFSACALQGLLANSFDSDDFIPLPKCKMEFISMLAVQHADKLIIELNK